MAQYKVGRSTIREAIKTLENVGILRVIQGSGAYVNLQIDRHITDRLKMNRSLLKEVNDVRYLLEKEILIQSIRYRTPDDIAVIKDALEDRKNAMLSNNFNIAVDADIRFHVAIATSTQNQILDEVYKIFTVRLREYFQRRDNGSTSHFAMVHGLHELLLQHIISRNEEEAIITLDKLLKNNYWRLGYSQ